MNLTRRIIFLSLAACALIPVGARAQERKDSGSTVLEHTLGLNLTNPYYQVAEVNKEGKVRVEVRPMFHLLRGTLIHSEGHYLLVTGSAADRAKIRLYRVQVEDVGPDAELTLSVGKEAARAIRQGDPALVFRPARSTTTLMKNLPDVIPLNLKGEKGPDNVSQEGAEMALQRAGSVKNLRQIGLAMHNFHSTYNQYLPAVIFGPDGKPWHSWRVIILGYIEQLDLYNQYDFGEPWDSAKNLKLLDRMPSVYRDPVYGDGKGHFTHYAALVGPRTAFTPEGGKMTAGKPVAFEKGGTSIRNMTDGTSNTVMIAPVSPDRKIPWTKPEDITVGPNFPGLGQPGGIAAPYKAGPQPGAPQLAPVLLADGSVHFLPATISSQVLDALMTINGGEIIPSNTFSTGGSIPRPVPQAMLRIRIEGGKASATLE
jgi:hypothetical protein